MTYGLPQELLEKSLGKSLNDMQQLLKRIQEKSDQTVAAQSKLCVNTIGYLPTNMTAKVNNLKKILDKKKKAKSAEEDENLDEDYKRQLLEMEWQRIEKLKKAYLLYINYDIDCHYHALVSLTTPLNASYNPASAQNKNQHAEAE